MGCVRSKYQGTDGGHGKDRKRWTTRIHAGDPISSGLNKSSNKTVPESLLHRGKCFVSSAHSNQTALPLLV